MFSWLNGKDWLCIKLLNEFENIEDNGDDCFVIDSCCDVGIFCEVWWCWLYLVI